jgi:hypothetical protein
MIKTLRSMNCRYMLIREKCAVIITKSHVYICIYTRIYMHIYTYTYTYMIQVILCLRGHVLLRLAKHTGIFSVFQRFEAAQHTLCSRLFVPYYYSNSVGAIPIYFASCSVQMCVTMIYIYIYIYIRML